MQLLYLYLEFISIHINAITISGWIDLNERKAWLERAPQRHLGVSHSITPAGLFLRTMEIWVFVSSPRSLFYFLPSLHASLLQFFISPSLWNLDPPCLSLTFYSTLSVYLLICYYCFFPSIWLSGAPVPPRWTVSLGPGQATRTKLQLNTHRTNVQRSTRNHNNSTLTNCAWTPSGVRWRPYAAKIAVTLTLTLTAPVETPDTLKVSTETQD